MALADIRPGLEGSSPHPYIPNRHEDVQEMLSAMGKQSIKDLFVDIPVDKLDPNLNLPEPLSEQGLMEHVDSLARKNRTDLVSFLGAGDYRHYIPAVVNYIRMLPGFYSAYTPYQPEISQGTLTTAFEAQTMMCEMMYMDMANTGMYDEATALAEAALMAIRVTGRRRVVALNNVHPNNLDTVRTYLFGQDIELTETDPEDFDVLDESAACVLVQSPDYFGYIADQESWINKAHRVGALGVVSVNNLLSLGMFKRPGKYGADIVVGEGSSIGNPMVLGGMNLGIFTAREQYRRQLPGRIVGRANDAQERSGFVLTLQTREQHIRRENATSNICTSEQLVALGFVVHSEKLGPHGFKALARLNYDKAHYAAKAIAGLPGFGIRDGVFLNEFVIESPTAPTIINRRLLEEGIIGGKDVSDGVRRKNSLLACVTEIHSRQMIDDYVQALRRVAA